MSGRATARLAFALTALWLVLEGLGLALLSLTHSIPPSDSGNSTPENVIDSIAAATYASVGLVLASRRPKNAIGWGFLAVSLSLAVVLITERFAEYALLVNPGSLRGGGVAAALRQTTFIFLLTAVAFLLLLFPHGRLPSRRWRPATWLLSAFAVAWIGGTLSPGPLPRPYEALRNPLGIGALDSVGPPLFYAVYGLIPVAAAAGVSLIRRFRRARGAERQQYKWFTFAAALLPLGLVANVATSALAPGANGAVSVALAFTAAAAFSVALIALPVSVGTAILRYRLYEIDRIINRTLVYGALTAILAGLYFGIVIGLQAAFSSFTQGNELAVAGSTLAVAALFRPARSRIQALVDRRFYRSKVDAERTLAGFSARLRQEIDLDSLDGELRGVVRETMQPAHVSLWLRPQEAER